MNDWYPGIAMKYLWWLSWHFDEMGLKPAVHCINGLAWQQSAASLHNSHNQLAQFLQNLQKGSSFIIKYRCIDEETPSDVVYIFSQLILGLGHILADDNLFLVCCSILNKKISETNKERERNMEGFSLYFMFISSLFNLWYSNPSNLLSLTSK